MIGVCFQELGSPILARKAGLLQEVFRECGYFAMIELTSGDRMREAEAIRHFLAMRVEGIVLVGSSLCDEEAESLMVGSRGVPMIWVDPEQRVSGERLCLDRAYSMELVLDHLHGLGHRRFAVLGIDPENPYGAFRWPALIKHAKALGLDVEHSIFSIYEPGRMEHTYDYGRELAERCLRECPFPISAVIALNDRVAIGAINRFWEEGIRVPEDLSVTGYDNLDIGAHFRPTLTTVDQDAERLMRTAVEVLRDRIEGQSNQTVGLRLIKPQLIARGSTAEKQREVIL
jgi:DNA-binding LacI/PurR family transcriptional regulator